jgi:GT2 family glycosyltransferase
MAAAQTLSVVVITKNEGGELKATLDSLLASLPRGRSEVIVVDDASSDGSTRFLERHSLVRLIRADGIGVAKARNFGASHATGDVVVFCDAHMRVPRGWHRTLLEPLQSPAVGAVAPGVYSLTEPNRRGFGLYFDGPDLHARWKRQAGRRATFVPILPGCFLAMRRDVFDAVGGFDPGMQQLGGNDNELCLRLWLLGYGLLIVPSIEVGHLFRTSVPFEATWAAVVHNRLRLAFVHFGHARIERVVDALRGYQSFPNGLAMTVSGDIFARRTKLHRQRRRSDDWFFDEFCLTC